MNYFSTTECRFIFSIRYYLDFYRTTTVLCSSLYDSFVIYLQIKSYNYDTTSGILATNET